MTYGTNKLSALLCLLMGFSWISTAAYGSETSKPTVQSVLNAAVSEDDALSKWLDELFNDSIKDGVDREVDQILRTHPMLKKLKPEIENALSDEMSQMRMQLQLTAGKAYADENGLTGQFQDKLAMVKEVARQLNFPEDVISDANVFIIPNSTVNAFTFSGLPNESIDAALYEGIIDLLSPEELKAVLGHELGHIKARHVLNQILLVSVFLGTGENIIPNDPDLPNAVVSKQGLRDAIYAKAKSFASHNRFSKSPHQELTHFELSLTHHYMNAIERVANILQKRMQPKQLNLLARTLGKAISEDAGDEDTTTAEEPDTQTQGEVSMEDLERFVQDLERYGRSCEVTADHFGVATTNVEAAKMVDIRLAAGKGASFEAMKRQAEEAAKIFQDNPALLEFAKSNQGSHPAVLMRAFHYERFAQTRSFNINSNPFLKGLYAYFAAAESVEMMTQQRINSDTSELIVAFHKKQLEGRFEAFEIALKDVLAEEILNEFKSIKDPKNSFKALVNFLKEASEHEEELSLRARGPKGLIFQVYKALQSLPQNKVTKNAEKLIASFFPSEYEIKRSKNGQIIAVERSPSDLENGLESFEKAVMSCSQALTGKKG